MDIHVQKKKKKSRHRLHTFHKFCSNWITDIKGNCKAIKLLQKKIEKNLDNLGFGDNIDVTPNLQPMKGRNDKLNFLKVKNFCKKILSSE